MTEARDLAGVEPREGDHGRFFCAGSNLVGVPPEVLASRLYNETPRPLHITGVREFNRSLFTMLDEADSPGQAAEAFENYMFAAFGIDPEQREAGRLRHFRSSYLRLLRGWAYDANSPEGAVVKGWVESRFGLLPTFHHERLDAGASEAWAAYVMEKMSTRFHGNSIYVQLDLLYEFCQWSLRRFRGDSAWLRLYRGTNEMASRSRERTVRLNNVVSFSTDRSLAGAFGNAIIEADVPREKIVFYNELLPRHALRSEGEHLVLGGEYSIRLRYF